MLKHNLIANYLGQGWTALMGLVFIPTYIRYLGIESWGLVAFMSTLQAWLLLLDAGMTPAVSREMARYTGGQLYPQSVRNLLRTIEVFLTALAMLIVGAFALASPWLASHWLTRNNLSAEHAAGALMIMGIVLAGRLVEQGYRGVLRGLQHQVWLSGADALLATIRWAGAAAVVVIYPDITAFFLWQALTSILTLCVLAREANRVLPRAPAVAQFDPKCLWKLRHFAGGMLLITVLTLALTQIDKLLLSKLLPLAEYGVYMLAAALAGGLSFLVMPATLSVGPRLAQLVALGDEQAVADLFHKASEWVACIVVPITMTIIFFARDTIWVWTGDGTLADQASPILVPLALGTMLNGFMHIPYQTQLAYGWTRLAVTTNAIAVAFLLPAILFMVPDYGALAAAWIWCVLNVGYVMIVPQLFHKRLLKNEKWNWYKNATAKPVVFSMLATLPAHLLLELIGTSRMMAALIITLTAVTSLAIVFFTMPRLRIAIGENWRHGLTVFTD